MIRRANTNNGDGWYVVIDRDQCVVFAASFSNNGQRNVVETQVAQHLVPGTFYGCGNSLREALEQAMTRYLSFHRRKGEQDAGTQAADG